MDELADTTADHGDQLQLEKDYNLLFDFINKCHTNSKQTK